MKSGVASLTYSVVEPKTYLVVTMEEGVSPIRFCCHMAECNQIPGLLPVSQQIENGLVVLYYDISGKQRLTDLLKTNQITENAFLSLIEKLCRGFQGLADYFLRAAQCVLELDHTYIDSYGNPFLPLLPMKEDAEDSAPELRNYFTSILGAYGPAHKTSSQRLTTLIHYVIQPGFQLNEFVKLWAQEIPVYSTPQTASPVLAEQPPFQAPCPEAAPPRPALAKKKPAAAGVKIPGMGDIVIPEVPEGSSKKRKKKPKAETEGKSEKKYFSLFGKKKDSPQIDMEKAALMVPEKIPVPAGLSPQAGQWKGTVPLTDQGLTTFDTEPAERAVLNHNGQQIVLNQFPFTIGRQSGCQYIVNNSKISRRHATILNQEGTFFIQDENSSNHTHVNGVMLSPYTPVLLTSGCEIRLGPEIFHFHLEGM